MTEERVDIFAVERMMLFRQKVDELAFLMAGLSGEKAGLVLDAVIKCLQDELGDEVLDLFVRAVLVRKIQIDRGAAPLRLQ